VQHNLIDKIIKSSDTIQMHSQGSFQMSEKTTTAKHALTRPQSRNLESQTANLQSLWLASRLKPWLRTTDGLWWLTAASHGIRVQTRKLTAAN